MARELRRECTFAHQLLFIAYDSQTACAANMLSKFSKMSRCNHIPLFFYISIFFFISCELAPDLFLSLSFVCCQPALVGKWSHRKKLLIHFIVQLFVAVVPHSHFLFLIFDCLLFYLFIVHSISFFFFLFNSLVFFLCSCSFHLMLLDLCGM